MQAEGKETAGTNPLHRIRRERGAAAFENADRVHNDFVFWFSTRYRRKFGGRIHELMRTEQSIAADAATKYDNRKDRKERKDAILLFVFYAVCSRGTRDAFSPRGRAAVALLFVCSNSSAMTQDQPSIPA